MNAWESAKIPEFSFSSFVTVQGRHCQWPRWLITLNFSSSRHKADWSLWERLSWAALFNGTFCNDLGMFAFYTIQYRATHNAGLLSAENCVCDSRNWPSKPYLILIKMWIKKATCSWGLHVLDSVTTDRKVSQLHNRVLFMGDTSKALHVQKLGTTQCWPRCAPSPCGGLHGSTGHIVAVPLRRAFRFLFITLKIFVGV